MTTCATCQDALTVEVETEDEDDMTSTQTVPDDVVLQCGDHFHWQCLLDSVFELSQCPACNSNIATLADVPGEPQKILASVNNEGGVQPELDLFPVLQEELYLKTFPEERRCRAFLEFCREGDYHAAVGVLQSLDDDDDEDQDNEHMDGSVSASTAKPAADIHAIIRYQDPLAGEQSALHAAVANGHREVTWLLLLLASSYPETEFPALVFQEAATLGVMRGEQDDKIDIRELKDSQGRSAEDIAIASSDANWNGWIGSGRLAMPK